MCIHALCVYKIYSRRRRRRKARRLQQWAATYRTRGPCQNASSARDIAVGSAKKNKKPLARPRDCTPVFLFFFVLFFFLFVRKHFGVRAVACIIKRNFFSRKSADSGCDYNIIIVNTDRYPAGRRILIRTYQYSNVCAKRVTPLR